jgi:hypothetical protein
VTIQDPNGRFTDEVWAAVRNWSDIGGVHVFYVRAFDPPGGVGGGAKVGRWSGAGAALRAE